MMLVKTPIGCAPVTTRPLMETVGVDCTPHARAKIDIGLHVGGGLARIEALVERRLVEPDRLRMPFQLGHLQLRLVGEQPIVQLPVLASVAEPRGAGSDKRLFRHPQALMLPIVWTTPRICRLNAPAARRPRRSAP